ncbi:MAG: helix-turn-helix transcriptional regulator, partial [Holophagales bacterium]|nr:helix-turn-helix transcriptional regulator [Holophagales bacterium]
AERVGIPASDLSRIERDELRVSLDVLIRIVAEFNVGLDELMGKPAGRPRGRRQS